MITTQLEAARNIQAKDLPVINTIASVISRNLAHFSWLILCASCFWGKKNREREGEREKGKEHCRVLSNFCTVLVCQRPCPTSL